MGKVGAARRRGGSWRLMAAVPAIATLLGGGAAQPAVGQTYSLSFSSRSNRMTWRPALPSWSYTAPVALSAAGDSTSMLRITASASLSATLNQRSDRDTWQENASVRTALNYPILGPKASIGVNASMSSRNATLLKQKIRSQTYSFRFQYRPLVDGDGSFRSLRINLTPGVITARRASAANLDSTIEEQGLQYNASLSVSPDMELAGRKVNASFSLSKRDNTLENNKNRSESLRVSGGYTLPRDVRVNASFSESRSELGATWAKTLVEEDGSTARDSLITSISSRRSRNASATVSMEVAGFDINSSQSWSDSRNTNTANADDDPRNRYFTRDRESQRWQVRTTVSGKLPGGVVGRSTVSYSTSEQRRLPYGVSPSGEPLRDPTDDIDDRDLSLRGSLDWQVTEHHSLELSGTAGMVRVDNPGAPAQERDTYNQNVGMSYRGAAASGLNLDVSLTSGYTHRVNLDASRASHNSRNRELRLTIITSYARLGASISHNFEISARRTIFDFDRRVNPVDRQSNIRRGWSMRHTARRSFFDHLALNGSYTYRADDYGTLLVDENSQIVEQENADHLVAFGMSYRPSTELTLGVNYSYRLDRHWDHTYLGISTDADENEHRNLSGNLSYTPGGLTSLSMRASRSRQRSGTFDSLVVTLSRRV